MSEPDIKRILDFWFAGSGRESPRVDSRMDRWFRVDEKLDSQIRDEFGDLVERASNGELDDWTESARGRLALILLLDQFRRNIYRGSPDAFTQDSVALNLCIEGTVDGCHRDLTPIQQLFFFMPMQHAESLAVQKKSVGVFVALADSVTETMRETFRTAAQFAELHHDIVAEFGRFPHRNAILKRQDTAAEAAYLTEENPTFGQSPQNA